MVTLPPVTHTRRPGVRKGDCDAGHNIATTGVVPGCWVHEFDMSGSRYGLPDQDGETVAGDERDERATGPDVETLDAAAAGSRHPPLGQVGRIGPRVPHVLAGRADDSVEAEIELGVHCFCSWVVTNRSRRSVRSIQLRRCSSSQSSTSANRSRLSSQVRTRPDFAVRMRPFRLEHPHVLHERRQRHGGINPAQHLAQGLSIVAGWSSGPGGTRTHTGTDLNRVPLPIGLRARPAQPIPRDTRTDRAGCGRICAGHLS